MSGDAVMLPASLVDRLASVLERIELSLGVTRMPAEPGGLLTKQEVARRLGGRCSVRRVERLMAKGKLKKVVGLGARTVRFRPADVERLLADSSENRPGGRRL